MAKKYNPNAPIQDTMDSATRNANKMLKQSRDKRGLNDTSTLENPSVDLISAFNGMTDGFLDTMGSNITPVRAMKQVAFFSCVNVLAKTIASTEVLAYTRNGRSRVAVENDSRADLIAYDPNPEMTAYGFWQFVVMCMCVWGTAYVWMETDPNGNIVALWPIAPARIDRGIAPDGSKVWIVMFGDNERSQSVLMDDEVMIFRGLGMETGTALAPYAILREELGIAAAATDYAGRLFQNFAVPGGVYSMDKPMSDEQFATFLGRQRAAHEGLKNSHKMAVLPPGMTYTETSFDPSNLQMVDARTMQTKMVAMAFGIPPRMLGINDGTSSYASVEQDSINFVTHCLRPWFVNLQQTVRKAMFSFPADKAQGVFIEFDTRPLLVPDSISRAKMDQSDLMFGVRNTDEVREDRGLPPLENGAGEVYWKPINMSPLDAEGMPLTPRFPEATVTEPAPTPDPLGDPIADPASSNVI